MPDEARSPSDDKEGDGRVLWQKMPDDDIILSKEGKRDDRIPPEDEPDDNVIPSEDQQSVEHISQNYEIVYNETFLLR